MTQDAILSSWHVYLYVYRRKIITEYGNLMDLSVSSTKTI